MNRMVSGNSILQLLYKLYMFNIRSRMIKKKLMPFFPTIKMLRENDISTYKKAYSFYHSISTFLIL